MINYIIQRAIVFGYVVGNANICKDNECWQD